LIAGPNSIIGTAASHMRSKWASNFAAAPASRISPAADFRRGGGGEIDRPDLLSGAPRGSRVGVFGRAH
jgi:hypothetical protein